jgi:hypothetical protein
MAGAFLRLNRAEAFFCKMKAAFQTLLCKRGKAM